MNKADQIPWYYHRIEVFTERYSTDQASWQTWARDYWQGRVAGLTRVKSSAFAIVHYGYAPDLETVCYIKQFLMRNVKDRLKHAILPSRAKRAAAGAERLSAFGFKAPQTLCLIEERRLGIVTGSALITKAEPCPSVRELLETYNSPELLSKKRQLLTALGRELGRMHNVGLHHGDTNLGNMLVLQDTPECKFLWLDNERVRKFANVSNIRRLENLRQLNKESTFLTGKDRICFWRAYKSTSGLTPTQHASLRQDAKEIIKAYWQEYTPPTS